MENCPYCRMDSVGNHEIACPNNASNYNKDIVMDGLMNALNGSVELTEDGPMALIRDYLELIGAYGLTLDILEDAGGTFDANQLSVVASFIKRALDKKIEEILACEENMDG